MKTPEITLAVAALIPWATVLIAAYLTPRFSRPDIFFAVTVSPGFRESASGQEILRTYHTRLIAAALFALILLIVAEWRSLRLMGFVGPLLVALAGSFLSFLHAHRSAQKYHAPAETVREASLSLRPGSLPGGWLAQSVPFLILGAVSLALALNWAQIPVRFPMHWDAHGNPNGWGTRRPFAVFGPIIIGFTVCGLLATISYSSFRGLRRVNASGSGSEREDRFLRNMSLAFLGISCWLALLIGGVSLAPLRSDPNAQLSLLWPVLLVQFGIIAGIIVVAIRAGQGGWKGAAASASAIPVGDRTPDECWKLGLIYYNPADPAVWVEKRFGFGWTLNFARGRSLAILGLILVCLGLCLTAGFVASRP